MGDMADMFDYTIGADEPSEAECLFYGLSQKDLLEQTGFVRSEKLKSIRRQGLSGKVLSDKQRWCLCFALAEHEERT